MRRLFSVLFAVGLVLGVAAPALADQPALPHSGGVIVRVNGDATLASGEQADLVFVTNGNALVEGTADTVIVINGTASLQGATAETVVVVNGTAVIGSGTRVLGDVRYVNSRVERATDAVVLGQVGPVDLQIGFWLWQFLLLVWIGSFVAVILAGLVAAAVASRQVRRVGATMTGAVGASLLGAVGVWIGLPILAVFVAFTVVGIPTALGILLVILPALWFLGYISVGIRMGIAIVERGRVPTDRRPFLAALVGVTLLLIVSLLPPVGFLAGAYGSGAILATVARRRPDVPDTAGVTVQPPFTQAPWDVARPA